MFITPRRKFVSSSSHVSFLLTYSLTYPSSLQNCLFGILPINGIMQYVFLVTFISLNKIFLYYFLSVRINGVCQLCKLNSQSHVMLRSILTESGVVPSSSFSYLLGRLLLFSQLSKVVKRHLECIKPHKIEKEISYTCENPHFKQWCLHKPFCFCGEFGDWEVKPWSSIVCYLL